MKQFHLQCDVSDVLMFCVDDQHRLHGKDGKNTDTSPPTIWACIEIRTASSISFGIFSILSGGPTLGGSLWALFQYDTSSLLFLVVRRSP